MNLEFRHLIDPTLSPTSRVWVYQSSRVFSISEALEIEEILQGFGTQWNSHGAPVRSQIHLFFGQFIVFIADESLTTVGGCSTDSSVRIVKDIEKKYGVNMFDRTMLAFVINEKVQLLPLSQLTYAAANGFINSDTLYFNNLVQTKEELESKWVQPVSESWLSKKITFPSVKAE